MPPIHPVIFPFGFRPEGFPSCFKMYGILVFVQTGAHFQRFDPHPAANTHLPYETFIIRDVSPQPLTYPTSMYPSTYLSVHLPTYKTQRKLTRHELCSFQKITGQPSAHRQPLLDKQSRLVDLILKTEPPQFHSSKVREITHSLGSAIRPLLNRLHNPTDAARDLEQVADHAWELSSKILTSRLTFDFRFPEVSSRFSCQSMLPIWPHADPAELQAKHFRVALVTTPVITCRNDTGGTIAAHSVALADVFCMQ